MQVQFILYSCVIDFVFVVLIVPIDCGCVFFKISSSIYVAFQNINVYFVNSYCLRFCKGMSSSEDLSSISSTLDENAVIFPLPVKVKKESATDSEFEEKEAADLDPEQNWQEATSDLSLRRPRRRKAFLHGRRKSRKLLKSPSSEFVTKAKLKTSTPKYEFDIADWSAFDDYTLIHSIIHLMNIRNVALGVQFNRNVSEKELLWRWESMLFNKSISENLTEKLENVSYLAIREMQQKMPLNNYEMRLLYSVPFYSLPGVEVFENLINENVDVFYKTRIAQELRGMWLELYDLKLLIGQPGKFCSEGESVLYSENSLSNNKCNLFADPNPTEEDYSVLSEMVDFKLDVLQSKVLKYKDKIEALHQIYLGKNASLDMIDGGLRPVGSLVSKQFSFMIRSPKITIGFSDENEKMDVDLTLPLGHRPTGLIKALCATLRIDSFADIYLRSYINDYVVVNGKKIRQMRRIKLTHGSLIQIYDVDLELELEENLRCEIRKQLIQKMLSSPFFSETFDLKPLLSDDD
ncbi:Microspherule protein 1 [Trichinella pseudospiralis]|uniref:Microspherule protein 1 n=3 Tax=Trichinella pseudospiralis TaxID=6337 RepID=A0A0V1J8H8_TRIPS|nr:Microspherule protein 1 [Trichinella pseudospiralis]